MRGARSTSGERVRALDPYESCAFACPQRFRTVTRARHPVRACDTQRMGRCAAFSTRVDAISPSYQQDDFRCMRVTRNACADRPRSTRGLLIFSHDGCGRDANHPGVLFLVDSKLEGMSLRFFAPTEDPLVRNVNANCRLALFGWFAFWLLMFSSADAAARIETFNWGHPTPGQVEGFTLHYGTSPGVYDMTVDCGSSFSHSLIVPDSETIYVAVSAYNMTSGVISPLSNEIVRVGDAGGNRGPGEGSDRRGGGGNSGGGGGADWFENLESVALGTNLPGWRDTGPDKSLIEDDSLFDVVELGGNRVLRTTSTENYIHSHYLGSDSATWRNYQIRGRFLATDVQAKGGLTSHSSYSSEDSYYSVGTHWLTGEFQITGAPSPWITTHAGFQCSSKGTGVFVDPNVWYGLVLSVDIGDQRTDLRAKAWAEGDGEPTAWQAHCWGNHPNLPSQGTIGVWSGSQGAKYWDDLSVAFVPEPASGTAGLMLALGVFAARRSAGGRGR